MAKRPTPGNDVLNGTGKSETIDGLAGNDTIRGFAGNDSLIGNVGNDSIDGGVGHDTLTGGPGTDTLLGSTGNDLLDGGADNDRLEGGAGSDTLIGGTGADTLIGGDGSDLYVIDNKSDVILEGKGKPSDKDSVQSSLSYSLGDNLENLTLTGLSDLNGTGNDGRNTIIGNDGNNLLDGKNGPDKIQGGEGDDTLLGGGGPDTLIGGDGSDTYEVSSPEDLIIEEPDEGDHDKVETSINYKLGKNLEDLTLTGGSNLTATGNELDNVIEGNSGANFLQGDQGQDILNGDAGNDTLEGGLGNDTIDGGEGNDQAIYQGNADDYKISFDQDSKIWVVEDIEDGDGMDEGTDEITNVESLKFSDQVISISDSGPILGVSAVTQKEGTGSTDTSFEFTVSLSAISIQPVTVDYNVHPGTAKEGSDFSSTSGQLTFEPGEQTKTISVPVKADNLYEGDETFTVEISNPSGATIGQGEAVGTIQDDDPVTVSIVGIEPVPEGNSGSQNVLLTVKLSAPSTQPITVGYATQNGSASAGSDYTTQSGTLTFNPNTTLEQSIRIPVSGDTEVESDETFLVVLKNPQNANLSTTASRTTVTIQNDDVPKLLISDGKITEGDKDQQTVDLTVSLSERNPTKTVTVDYTTVDGTATVATNDYTFSQGTLSFAPGESQKTIHLSVTGDTFVEPDETFSVVLANSKGAVLGEKPKGTVTIVNNDIPTLSIDSTKIDEGDYGNKNALLTVSLSQPSYLPVKVSYETSEFEATAGQDFISTSGVLLFAPNEMSKQISIPIVGDVDLERDESFRVNLSNPSNAKISETLGSGTVTVVNDDLPKLSITGPDPAQVNENDLTAVFSVDLSAPFDQKVTVQYSTMDGTAVAGSDYTLTNGTLTFEKGTTHQEIKVPLLDDRLNELDESFKLILSNPEQAKLGEKTSAEITIKDNDPEPELFITGVSQKEGSSGNLLFTVTLSSPSSLPVTVHYATQDGTATVTDGDYTPTSGELSFAPGEISKTISVPVKDDQRPESDETLKVVLSSPTHAQLNASESAATATLLNDDWPILSITGATTIDEGNSIASLTVGLSAATPFPVTVNYATANGSATAGSDYTPTSGSLSFAAGEISKTVSVPILDDKLVELDETFQVVLTNPTGAILDPSSSKATVTIRDTDTSMVSVANFSLLEGSNGANSANLTVTLSAPSAQPITVNYVTTDGSATAGSDYTPTSGSLSFAAGETSKTITVPINGDTTIENDETFKLSLSLPSTETRVTLDPTASSATVTILNDDFSKVSITGTSLKEGDSGSQTATLAVSLSAAAPFPITVNYATTDGSATAGSDYTSTSGSLSFAAGETSKTITVPINGDTTIENDETFKLSLSLPSTETRVTLDPTASSATVTILNDDFSKVSITGTSLKEGDSGSQTATLAVSLSAAAPFPITVNYATTDGSATAGSDYTPTSGSLSFAAGETSKTITVPIIGDTRIESDETFRVTLNSPTNAVIGTGEASVTILNDDLYRLSLSSTPSAVTEGGTWTYTVTSDQVVQGAPLSIPYTLSGTAIPGSDYSGGQTSGAMTIPVGSSSASLSLTALSDSITEGAESVVMTLGSGASSVYTVNTGPITTTINDPVIISLVGTSVIEGNSGTSNATLTVSLSSSSSQPITVNYATADNGSATAGIDYSASAGSLTFNAGETSKTIIVPILGDTSIESNETFLVTLNSPTNAVIGTGQASVTILNDDQYHLTLSAASTSITEGATLTYIVTSDQVVQGSPLNIPYTLSGTATPGSDYSGGQASGSLTIPAGSSSASLSLTTLTDSLTEGTETIVMTLGTDSSNSYTVNTGTVITSLIDYTPVSLSIVGTSVSEGNSGTTLALVGVSLSAPSALPVTVSYATADDSSTSHPATAGGDYLATSGTLSFSPGETFKTIPISVYGDTTYEYDETFQVRLSQPINATLSNTAATVTIQNDDPFIQLPTEGADSLTGTEGNDTINALGGNDTVYGLGGNDSLLGGSGSDIIYGGSGADTLQGASFGDSFMDIDTLYGGDGDDFFVTLSGGLSRNISYGEAGNDTIYGNGGADTLSGGSGNDQIYGYAGSDYILGGDGNDTIDGHTRESGVSFGTNDVDTIDGGAGDDYINHNGGASSISGGSGNDTIYGNVQSDIIYGGSGNDQIKGYGGVDFLVGGAGVDTLTGGSGLDIFSFGLGDSGVGIGNSDIITDFSRVDDIIDLSGLSSGTLSFIGNASSFTALDQVAYYIDWVTGNLILAINLSSSAGQEMEIEIAGITSISTSDILL
jgi:Ca2+-binding RTX toxin-like protein